VWKSPILSFGLWKTKLNMWKTCGEGVEKVKFRCGKSVEFVGKIKSIIKLCKFLDGLRSQTWSLTNYRFSAQDVIENSLLLYPIFLILLILPLFLVPLPSAAGRVP